MTYLLFAAFLYGVPCHAALIFEYGRKPPGTSPYKNEFIEAAKAELRNGREVNADYQIALRKAKREKDLDRRRSLAQQASALRDVRDDSFTRAVLWMMKAKDLELDDPVRTVIVPGPHEGLSSTWRVLVMERQKGGDGPLYEHSVEAHPKPSKGFDKYRDKALGLLSGVANGIGLSGVSEWAEGRKTPGAVRYLRYFTKDEYNGVTSYDGLTVIHSEMFLEDQLDPDSERFRTDVLVSSIYHERTHFEDRTHTDDCSTSMIECEQHALGKELNYGTLLETREDYQAWVRERLNNTEKYYPQFSPNVLEFSNLEDQRPVEDIREELARINQRADALRASVDQQSEELKENESRKARESSSDGQEAGQEDSTPWMPKVRSQAKVATMPAQPTFPSYSPQAATPAIPYCVGMPEDPTRLVEAAIQWCGSPQNAGTWDPFLSCVTRYSEDEIVRQTDSLDGCSKVLAADLMKWNNDTRMRRPTAETLKKRIESLPGNSRRSPSSGVEVAPKERPKRPCRKGVWSKDSYDLPDC